MSFLYFRDDLSITKWLAIVPLEVFGSILNWLTNSASSIYFWLSVYLLGKEQGVYIGSEIRNYETNRKPT